MYIKECGDFIKLNIAICDDDREYLKIIEGYLDTFADIHLDYDIFESGEELIDIYRHGETVYDSIFLDMEMKNIDGIETANIIRQYDDKVIIIFATSHTKYMQKSFECNPFRFLVKPVIYEEFKKVFYEMCIKINEEKQTFIFTENRNKIRLFCEDIIFFESKSHHIWIYTKEKTYKIYKTFQELQNQIDEKTFSRSYKSFIVNLSYVKEIKDCDIVLYNYNEVIPLSRKYKKAFINAFMIFRERKYLI